MSIPIVRPALGDREVAEASRVIRSGWVTQGPEVAAFEREFASTVGAAHAVAVSNCTVALELALRCLGVGPGDDVVTVSHSFIATANAVRAVGARPVFVDIDPATYGMSPAAAERAVTSTTKAILAVHQIGMPCELGPLLALARSRGIPLIEDAACAIGSEIQLDGTWQRIGKPHGAVACFSFHPRKIVTTGDGGMMVTADPELAKRARLLRQHAMSVPDTIRHHSAQVTFEEYVEPAFNYRLTDLQASIGRPQLARLSEIVAERRALAARYHDALSRHPIVRPVPEPPWARSNWQSFPVRLVPGSGARQKDVMQFLLDRGVATRRGVHNAHQEPAYAGKSPQLWTAGPESGPSPLAESEAARDQTILIPLFGGMTAAEQDYVIATLGELPSRS